MIYQELVMTPTPSKNKHSAFQKLPIVDISLLSSDNFSDRKKVAETLRKAASEVGFLYITGHDISPDIIKRLKDKTQEYFLQPLDKKMEDYIGKSIANDFVVGYGLDYDGYGRNLPDIYSVVK